MNNQKTIAELSVDAQVLIKTLLKVEPEQVISYADLSRSIDKNVQTKARHLLETARRKIIKNHHILFDVVHNEGLKRVKGAQIVAVGSRNVKQIGRHARRSIKKMACIGGDFIAMTRDDQHRFNGIGAILALVSHTTKEKQVNKISAASSELLPMNKALELFK